MRLQFSYCKFNTFLKNHAPTFRLVPTNAAGYINRQAVSDGRIVTANGSATLEFAREMLLLLNADTPEAIDMFYRFNKDGFCALSKFISDQG